MWTAEHFAANCVIQAATILTSIGSLEADVALEYERIAALTRQKRGLMQKLLTGEWRLEADKLHEVSL